MSDAVQTETAAGSRPNLAKTAEISVWKNPAARSLQVSCWQLSASGGDTQEQLLRGPVHWQVGGEQALAG
jgi:hypothetical protein